MAGKQQTKNEPDGPNTKKGSIWLIVLVGAVVLLCGAGFAGYAVARTREAGRTTPDPMQPHLQVRDGESDQVSLTARDLDAVVDPRIYKPSYYPLQEPLTSNLAGSDAVVQANIGFGTFYDSKVLDNVKDNEVAIRSLVLATLASEDAEALATPEGKRQLLLKIREKVNDFLVRDTGYGGIEGAYFTSLVVQ